MNTLSKLLVVGLASPLLTMGLDLGAVNTSLTRADADSLYSERYEYSILKDLSIRRVWEDAKHRVSLDFEVANDRLIMAQLYYKSPLDKTLALEDAKAMLPKGLSLGKWKKANAEQTETLGLGDCFYQKLENGSFFFIELNKQGQAECLLYFASTPRLNRRKLAVAETEAYTAMGSNPNASAALVLLEDEAERGKYRQKAAEKRNKPSGGKTSVASNKPSPTARPIASTSPQKSTSKGHELKPAHINIPLTSEAVEAPKAGKQKGGTTLETKLTLEKLAILAGIILVLIVLIYKLSPKKESVRKMSSPSGVRRLR